MRRVLLAALCLAVPAPLFAQSVYGPGGLFINPTASLPKPHQVTPSTLVLAETHHVDTGLPSTQPAGAGSHASSVRRATWISSSIDYGVNQRLEVGAAVAALTDVPGNGNPSIGGYAKYLLVPEGAVQPAVAVGATLLGLGQTGFREGFVALRKKIPSVPVHADFGVQYADLVDGIHKHAFEPFAGLEAKLAPQWNLAVEGRPRLNGDSGLPVALTLIYQKLSGYQLALTWANNGSSTTPHFGFGVGYALGTGK